MRHGGLLLGLTLAGLGLLAGCEGPGRRDDASTQPTPVSRSTPEALRARAQELLDARIAKDWKTVFKYEPADTREKSTAEDFAEWSQENEPFDYTEGEILAIENDSKLGWVQVRAKIGMRKYPGVPPHEVTRWEKWHVVDGAWYPVNRGTTENYPAPPSSRDAAEEARLRARIETAGALRTAGRWEEFYDLLAPQTKARTTPARFADAMTNLNYLEMQLDWVEVIGTNGRALVFYKMKLNDPAMQKLEPKWMAEVESWEKIDGEWYLNLGA